MSQHQILIVDDHQIVRKGLRSLLESNDQSFFVEEAQNIHEALAIMSFFRPNVVLLDYRLDDIDGAEATKRILFKYPNTKIIILTAFDDQDAVLDCVNSGAMGFLLKTIDGYKIIEAIHNVLKGNTYFDEKVVYQLMCSLKKKPEVKVELSEMEINILNNVCMGKTNKEIAEEVYMAEKTIRNYLSKIFQKINVKNRTEAAIYWNDRLKK